MKRREFIRTGLLTTAAVSAFGKDALANETMQAGAVDGFHAKQTGTEVELQGPAFAFKLDLARGLTAVFWRNHLTGKTIPLGGNSELNIDLDRAEQRIQIPGWRGSTSHAQVADADQDPGLKEGFARPGFDDSKWQKIINLTMGEESSRSFTWGRTRVTIPASAEGKLLSLTLGGFGLFDHRFMRVFLNGSEVGARRATGRWHEPLTIDLGAPSKAQRFVRYGGDNLIAVQLSEFVTRTTHLDELDTVHGRVLPGSLTWPGSPAQFEQYLTIGSLPMKVEWGPARLVSKKGGASGEAVFELQSAASSLSALVTYRWEAKEPVLRKFSEITNRSPAPLRIMHVRLGNYRTGTVVSEGEQGFPVYIEQDFFAGLAHPYGWVTGEEGTVQLRQYPGTKLSPGETFQCMEAVYGVAEDGEAQKVFLSHLKRRMRRVVRGHDKPYAIFDALGGQPRGKKTDGDFNESEDYILDNIAKVTRGQQESGCHFDFYSMQFWVDYRGDITQADPIRFPNGFTKIVPALNKIGTKLGLWIDSSWEAWSVGGNPSVKPDAAGDPEYATYWGALCRATEPIKTMYSQGFRYHIRENGVRLLKFDNFRPLCYNAHHDHLPGVYSTEAIGNAVIQTYRDLDAENHDVLLMLYWGYRSPWWLLHADTLFECGLGMEASFPASSPTLYARDSVTQGLDQGEWYGADLPRMGKDSLGVWLSDWSWNGSTGKERWQEGTVMDLCRGSLLVQPWTDLPWLSPPERKQMADFIAFLKERPDCFGDSSFILGNPWKNELYGYVCSNGKRAFIALNNCAWKDAAVELELNRRWRLPGGVAWNLYRWYPQPARLGDSGETFASKVTYSLRPFEVVLLEAVPAGEAPSLGRDFTVSPIPGTFAEPTRELALAISHAPQGSTIKGEIPPCKCCGTLAIAVEMRKGPFAAIPSYIDGAVWISEKHFAATGTLRGKPVDCHAVLGNLNNPRPWQTWRVAVEASDNAQAFQFSITHQVEMEAASVIRCYFLPQYRGQEG